ITWYLPDALTDATQKEIWAASNLLAPMLKKSIKVDGIWRTNQGWFKPSSENDVLTPRCINLSPAWFQQGHKVSTSLKGASSEKILKAIARPGAIARVALRVMHPEQYWAGLRAFSSLGEKAESKELPKMSETLQYLALVFNSLSMICNQQTLNHQDHLLNPECFNILTMVGNYSNAQMSMPSLQLEFRYNPGCMIGFSRRIVRHGVHAVEGDQIAWAWYMRDSVHIYARVPWCGWVRVDYKQ
ncbi:hypothetical protein EV702DRAFT_977842, partial [Suillus placidus]